LNLQAPCGPYVKKIATIITAKRKAYNMIRLGTIQIQPKNP